MRRKKKEEKIREKVFPLIFWLCYGYRWYIMVGSGGGGTGWYSEIHTDTQKTSRMKGKKRMASLTA